MGNRYNKQTWRYFVRTLTGKSINDRINRDNTYTYSDGQVVSIFRWGIVIGAVAGAFVALTVASLS